MCLRLIRADSEDEVVKILSENGYWDDLHAWRDFGDNDNNYSTAGAQQSDPVAALVEKLVNSADARLMNECLSSGIQPDGADAPQSVREAVARFIEKSSNPTSDAAGRIENWTPSERRDNARKITLAATGLRTSPCFSIADTGEGQTPSAIPNTFMSLNKSNKLRTPFVQGKFNMGGTGVFRFCGSRSIQLIVTKRNPSVVDLAEPDSDKWSLTVVRRDDPTGGERSSVFRYLAPVDAGSDRKGGVLRFESDTMPIFPEGNEAYARPAEYGSLIKLYNYKLKGRSHILMKDGLLSAVGTRLPNPALPMMFHECRDYGGHSGSFSNPFTGLLVRLSDDRTENLEDGFPFEETITIEGQQLTLRIFGFKQKRAESYKGRSDGILFVVNGQTHGILDSRFFGRKAVKLGNISDSLLVYVDCSMMERRAQEELFMNTRESLAGSELRREIEKQLERAFAKNQMLRKFANKRREEKIQDKLDNDKPLEETLKSIMEKSPSLSSLFLGGSRLTDAFKPAAVKPADEFVGKQFPSYFRFKGKPQGYRLQRTCEHDRSIRINFETDVENNYFGRSKDRGYYYISCKLATDDTELSILSHHMNVFEGTATLNITLPDFLKVGDGVTLEVRVSDDSMASPFENICELTIVEKTQHVHRPSPPRPKPPSDEEGDGVQAPSKVGLPKAIWVDEADWEDHGFDKFSAVKIEQVPTDDDRETYDFYINADNFYLKNELKSAVGSEDVLKEQFKVGLVLSGLALIHDSKRDDSEDLEDRVFVATKALAMMILPIINLLGDLNTDGDVLEEDAA